MPELKKPYRYHFGRIAVLLSLLVMPLGRVLAQDSAQDSTAQPAPNGRIVEERPPLYSFKREVHPLTWMEWGAQPMFRSADSGFLHRLIARRGAPEKPAGIKFDLDGAGAGSGLGPLVTL